MAGLVLLLWVGLLSKQLNELCLEGLLVGESPLKSSSSELDISPPPKFSLDICLWGPLCLIAAKARANIPRFEAPLVMTDRITSGAFGRISFGEMPKNASGSVRATIGKYSSSWLRFEKIALQSFCDTICSGQPHSANPMVSLI